MWNRITTWASFRSSALCAIEKAPRLPLAFLIVCLLASPCPCREAGWVPIPKNQQEYRPPEKPGAPAPKKRAAKARDAASTARKAPPASAPKAGTAAGATVYDGQPLVTDAEVGAFLELLPRFRAWARGNGEEAHPIVSAGGRPDFLYSQAAAGWVRERGFEPARFFCVMGKLAAALAIVEEGNDRPGAMPPDMPAVEPAELALARKHLGSLLTAGGPPQPLK